MIKVILYMAISVNGMVAKLDDDTSWTSEEDWKSFNSVGKKVGNIIMGRRTFEIMREDNQFPVEDLFNVVVTHQDVKNEWGEKALFTPNSPEWILTKLEEMGFKEAFIGGGGGINSLFLKSGLVDEIYLDVEPVVFGKGIPLFAPEEFEYQLELLDSRKLNNNTIQLHYRVNR